QELRVALLTRQIHLAIQKKFSLKSGVPMGGEVLLRWQHPKHGLMNAEQWINLAESHKLMPQLSRHLVIQVIQLIKGQDDGNLPLAINLSPSCLDTELANFIIDHVKEARISPSHIEIEVTESSLPQDPQQLSAALRALRAQGIKVSLDDFGVGYNCLRYLIDLEVDAIKIDKSFLQKSSQCKVAHMTLKYMIDLAKSIDLEVVCEGIETQEQLFLAKTLGADIGQGFFLSKPQLLFPNTNSPINSGTISTQKMVG
ncbi:MAG TPA: EAL domain-containing protein, partial [Candidatus Nitrosotenuis sp.]|nr:EAL domain-containing protein [Candidatus Nitrosotenuis sp.]